VIRVGCSIEAVWAQDVLEGQGVCRFPNGDAYWGDFHANEMHGLGTLRFANGACFQGAWQHGKKHGHGRWKNAQGQVPTNGPLSSPPSSPL
jgi:hypothetical protein